MNVYPSAADAFLTGAIDVMTDTLRAQLVGTYVYDAGHQVLDDVTGSIGTAVIVGVDHVAGGAVYVDPLTFPAVPAGPTVTGLVVYQDTGDPATDRLLAHLDRRADTVPLAIEPTGGDITLSWPRLFKI